MYINHIQLKAARCLLNLGVREIGLFIQTSRTTISKLENNIIKLSEMRLGDRRNKILCEFFKKEGITFPNAYTLNFSPKIFSVLDDNFKNTTLTNLQLKASRVILNKTQLELAKEFNINVGFINRYEKKQTNDLLTISTLKNKLEERGIHFPNKFSITFENIS